MVDLEWEDNLHFTIGVVFLLKPFAGVGSDVSVGVLWIEVIPLAGAISGTLFIIVLGALCLHSIE